MNSTRICLQKKIDIFRSEATLLYVYSISQLVSKSLRSIKVNVIRLEILRILKLKVERNFSLLTLPPSSLRSLDHNWKPNLLSSRTCL